MKADEKVCPQCAETIKKAAIVCKHCGYKYSSEQLAAERKASQKANRSGCLFLVLAMVVGGVSLAMCSGKQGISEVSTSTSEVGATDSSEPADAGEQIAEYQVQAKNTMTASLKDPGSAQYQDVEAHEVASKPGVYVFCGEVNSKNGFGGYTGYQRFVAAVTIAATEDAVSGFDKLWRQFCTGAGTPVWF
jgi:hypothetical protein